MVFYYFLIGCAVLFLLGIGFQGGKKRAGMSAAEARQILGVAASAGEEEIREAYRRLIQKNHPDQGGSAYLASQINQAKDVLLGK